MYYFYFIWTTLSLSSNFLFRQCHCQKSNNFFFLFPSISIMLLPQTNCNNFFPSYFCNAIATNSFPHFPPSISAIPLPQTNCNNFFFPSYFGNAIATNQLLPFFFLFFLFLRNYLCTPFLQQVLNDKLLLIVIVGLKK